MTVITDPSIRSVLWTRLRSEYSDRPGTLIVDEMGLCEGAARIDLAVVNGVIHGFEIKSDRDSLDRLRHQARYYNSTLGRVTAVLGERHYAKALEAIPDWWGVILVSAGTPIEMNDVREAQLNPSLDPSEVVKLLWRHEAADLLSSLPGESVSSRMTRASLWRRLVEALPPSEVEKHVSERLLQRAVWPRGSAKLEVIGG